MSFVNALAHIANAEDHHPDLEVGYDYCRVAFTTHAIGGLSQNDFICAAKLDRPARNLGTSPARPKARRANRRFSIGSLPTASSPAERSR